MYYTAGNTGTGKFWETYKIFENIEYSLLISKAVVNQII